MSGGERGGRRADCREHSPRVDVGGEMVLRREREIREEQR